MTHLWVVGMFSAGATAVLGWPLMIARSGSSTSLRDDRLTGVWLLVASVAVALIAARHGMLLQGDWAQLADHATNALDLAAWPLLVAMAALAVGIRIPLPLRAAGAAPFVAYLFYSMSTGGGHVRFIWLLPVSLASAVCVVWLAVSAHRARDDRADATLAAHHAITAVLLAAAQTARTLVPGSLAVREIVPIAVAIAAFILARGLARAQRLAPNPSPQHDTRLAAAPRYERSALTADRAGALLAELDARMRSERWYRDPELSLLALARRLGISSHALSQALNQHGGQSFAQYLTGLRVADVREQLRDPANDFRTIDALSDIAGFPSRSAFYRAFRQVEGMTPTQFRQCVRDLSRTEG